MAKRKPTTDGLEIIHRRFFEGKPKQIAALEEARANDAVARKIYALRNDAGLTQRQLAKLIGTTASVICRLEDADYEGHSLAMLNRIAMALDRRVEINFIPLNSQAHPAWSTLPKRESLLGRARPKMGSYFCASPKLSRRLCPIFQLMATIIWKNQKTYWK